MVVGSLKNRLLIIYVLFELLGGAHLDKACAYVLVVHSYDKSYEWTGSIQTELEDLFSLHDLRTEYLDAKNHNEPAYFDRMYEVYAIKYKNQLPEVIVTADNHALIQTLRHREIFPNVPIVFCGINNFDPSTIDGQENITGVIERVDWRATIQAAMTMLPETQNIYVVHDQSDTALANAEIIAKLEPGYAHTAKFHTITNRSFAELRQDLANLPEHSIILYSLYSKDRLGETLDFAASGELVTTHATPAFTSWEFLLKHGFVGGMMTSGQLQGRAAGDLARRIRGGESVANLPVVLESPNALQFNETAMRKLRIPLSKIPRGSLVVNQQQLISDSAMRWIRLGIAFSLAQTLAIAVLVWFVRRNRQITLAAVQRNEKHILQSVPVCLFRCKPGVDGQLILTNPRFLRMMGYPQNDPSGIIRLGDIFENREDARNFCASLEAQGEIIACMIPFKKLSGEKIYGEISAKRITASGIVQCYDCALEDVSDRYRILEELRHSETRFRNVVDQAGDLIYMHNFDGRFIDVNQHTCEMLGYTRDELMEMSLADMCKGFELEEARQRWEALPIGAAVSLNKTLRTRTGREIPVDIRSGKFQIGRDIFYVSVCRDITEQLESARRLNEQSALLRQVLQNIPYYVFWKDTELRYLGCNEIYAASWGLDCPGEIHGKRDADLNLNGELPPMEMERELAVIRNGQPIINEERTINLPGKPATTMLMSKVPLKDSEGRIIGLLGVNVDISENMQREEELQIAHEHLKMILDTAATAVFTIDTTKRILEVNREFCDITGYEAEEIVGKPVMVIFGACAGRCEGYEEGMFLDITYRRECNIFTRDGRELTILKNSQVVYNADGEIVKGIESFIDVTGLVQAKELAEQAAKSKSDFLANMSHEIRTPINGITGMSALLKSTPLNSEQTEYANRIESSAISLLGVINDILDFSKIEAGKLEVELIPFDLRRSLEELHDLLSLTAESKGLAYNSVIDRNVPRSIVGDPGRLRQVLTNLIGNAMKFTADGEVAIYVTVDNEDEHQCTLRFRVKDTGIGIARNKLDSLFQPFTQADSSTTRRYGGTGLGLTICKQLVDLMGGEIHVKSKLQRGSEFIFTLPFAKADNPETHEPPIHLAEVARKRVLIVDENETGRQALRSQLEGWEMQVDEASSGESALARLLKSKTTRTPYDLVLTAMTMKTMDGAAFGMAVKQDPSIADTPLIAMTTLGRRGDAQRMKQAGFSGYLTTPVRQKKLFNMIVTVLGFRELELDLEETPIVTQHNVPRYQLGKKTILLVEDNETNQLVAKGVLGKAGFNVDAVWNGREALELLRARDMDLILMDSQMPVMDGYEATRQIRSGRSGVRNPAITIIAMTAHAMESDRQRCLAVGMDDYISKPFNPQELIRLIVRHLFDEDPAQPAEGSAAPPPGPEPRRKASRNTCAVPPPRPKAATAAAVNTTVPATPTAAGSATAVAQSPAPNERAVFNLNQLTQAVGEDQEVIREIVELFIVETPHQIASLIASSAAMNVQALKACAHRLKGASGNVGAERIYELAGMLEQDATTEKLDDRSAHLDELQDEYDRFVLSARQILAPQQP